MRKLKIAIPVLLILLVLVSYAPASLKVAADDNNNNNNDNEKNACQVKLPEASKVVINVKWTVINDEDSGLAGYWALDHYARSLTVYVMHNGTYAAFSNYKGVFVTPQGSISPGKSAATETETGFGTMVGCKFATFNATSINSGTQLKGNLGVKNYGGTTADVLKGTYASPQTGDLTAFNWSTYYFTGVINYAEPRWSFTYTLNAIFSSAPAKVWVNALSGNSGDILTETARIT
jgi:hypothetical protein